MFEIEVLARSHSLQGLQGRTLPRLVAPALLGLWQHHSNLCLCLHVGFSSVCLCLLFFYLL